MNNNMINYSAKEINELLDWISYNKTLFGDEVTQNLIKKLEEVADITALSQAVVFTSLDEMKEVLQADETGKLYGIGTSFFIIDEMVPDYWVVGRTETFGEYGYYLLEELESTINNLKTINGESIVGEGNVNVGIKIVDDLPMPGEKQVIYKTQGGHKPIPNNGHVNKVVFNNALSDEEVTNILSQLEYTAISENMEVAVILANENASKGLFVARNPLLPDVGFVIFIQHPDAEQPIDIWTFDGVDFFKWPTCWNPNIDLDTLSEFNIDAVSSVALTEDFILPVGNQNHLLTNLVYIDYAGGYYVTQDGVSYSQIALVEDVQQYIETKTLFIDLSSISVDTSDTSKYSFYEKEISEDEFKYLAKNVDTLKIKLPSALFLEDPLYSWTAESEQIVYLTKNQEMNGTMGGYEDFAYQELVYSGELYDRKNHRLKGPLFSVTIRRIDFPINEEQEQTVYAFNIAYLPQNITIQKATIPSGESQINVWASNYPSVRFEHRFNEVWEVTIEDLNETFECYPTLYNDTPLTEDKYGHFEKRLLYEQTTNYQGRWLKVCVDGEFTLDMDDNAGFSGVASYEFFDMPIENVSTLPDNPSEDHFYRIENSARQAVPNQGLLTQFYFDTSKDVVDYISNELFEESSNSIVLLATSDNSIRLELVKATGRYRGFALRDGISNRFYWTDGTYPIELETDIEYTVNRHYWTYIKGQETEVPTRIQINSALLSNINGVEVGTFNKNFIDFFYALEDTADEIYTTKDNNYYEIQTDLKDIPSLILGRTELSREDFIQIISATRIKFVSGYENASTCYLDRTSCVVIDDFNGQYNYEYHGSIGANTKSITAKIVADNNMYYAEVEENDIVLIENVLSPDDLAQGAVVQGNDKPVSGGVVYNKLQDYYTKNELDTKLNEQQATINTINQNLDGTTDIANTALSTANTLGDALNEHTSQSSTKITSIEKAIVELEKSATDQQTAINSLNQEVDTKQDALVSGTNIKTINGESILGSGNLVIKSDSTTVDSTFDGTSTNPVEAQAIEKHISDKLKPINETLNSKADSADLVNKQDTLVSGTNIKTINGESILGAGNINIGDNGETVSTMTGATSTLPGTSGLVPTPTAGSNTKFLRGDATWAEIPSDNSKQDKLIFDNEPTENSNNPVRSNGIWVALDNKQDSLPSQNAYTAKGSSTVVPKITTNSLGQVTNIEEVNIEFPATSSSYAYGVCTSATTTSNKSVALVKGGFKPENGAKISVYFSDKNSAANPKLIIDGQEALPIYFRSTQITTSTRDIELLYGMVDFVYNNGGLHIVGNYVDTDTTYAVQPAKKDGATYSLVTTGEKYTWNNKLDAINVNEYMNQSVSDDLWASWVAAKVILYGGDQDNTAYLYTYNSADDSFVNWAVGRENGVAIITRDQGNLVWEFQYQQDNAPTEGNYYPITSHGVYTALNNLENKIITNNIQPISQDLRNNYYTKTEVDGEIAKINTSPDLSNYYNKTETDTKIATAQENILDDIEQNMLPTKQNTLVSGTNIKTINGQSLLGSGNITIAAGDSEPIIIDSGILDLTAYAANTVLSAEDQNKIATAKQILYWNDDSTKYCIYNKKVGDAYTFVATDLSTSNSEIIEYVVSIIDNTVQAIITTKKTVGVSCSDLRNL